MPYLSARSFSANAFTGSFAASLLSAPSLPAAPMDSGRLPMRMSKSSPSTILMPFLSICWLAR